MKRVPIYPLLVIFMWGLTASCRLFHRSSPQYIFFITLDTTRADSVNVDDNNNLITPNLAKIASTGISFKNAYSLIPITLPSHFSMFYSLPPNILKIYNNGQTTKIHYPSMTQLLKENGYQTAAVISLGVLKSQFGLAKGFDHFLEGFKPQHWGKTAEEVNQEIFPQIKKMIGKKSFFWIHYSDPHGPHFPPEYRGRVRAIYNGQEVYSARLSEFPIFKYDLNVKPGKNVLRIETEIPDNLRKRTMGMLNKFQFYGFSITPRKENQKWEVKIPDYWIPMPAKGYINYLSKERDNDVIVFNNSNKEIEINVSFLFKTQVDPKFIKRVYTQEVQYMDKQIGKLVDFLKENNIYSQSAFVIMGDHGEGLGEYHGHVGHIHYLNKIYTQVNMILAGKGIPQDVTRNEVVSNLNIAPTILELAGIKKPDFMIGSSLLKRNDNKKVILETYSPAAYFDAFSIIDFPYQMIIYPGNLLDKKIEFINLEKDKFGVHPIPKDNGEENPEIRAKLYDAVLAIARRLIAIKGKIGNKTQETIEMLETLGYL